MQPYSLGIDIGTGSIKACAVGPTGQVLAAVQEPYGAGNATHNIAEQDPEQIWTAFATASARIVAQLNYAPHVVSLSSCMHSLLLVDADLKPLTPVITWADRRSAHIAAQLRVRADGEELYRRTGTPLHAMSPVCKLRWFFEMEHGLFKKMAKAISIKEFIWAKLFGVYEVDYSIASATGLFDIEANTWLPQALAFCQVQPSQLSTPVATQFVRTGITPEAARLLHLPETTPICIGASDGCLANVGSGALEAETAAVTVGTSGAVRVCSPKPIPVWPHMIFNYRLDAERFVCGGAINNGGNLVQWLINQFSSWQKGDERAYRKLFDEVAAAPPGADGLLCLPYLYGERTPLWNEEACGAFFGIRPGHSQKHFLRAGLEGICFSLCGILKTLEKSAGPITHLQVSGGLVQADVWMQMLADVTGKTVRLLTTDDASAIGAAVLGMNAVGLIPDYASIAFPIVKTIEPNEKAHQLYIKQHQQFETLYAALQPLMQAPNVQ